MKYRSGMGHFLIVLPFHFIDKEMSKLIFNLDKLTTYNVYTRYKEDTFLKEKIK